MSDDEPEFLHGDGDPNYDIIRPLWRHSLLNIWLKIFSYLDKINKWDVCGNAKKGKFMRARVESGRTDKGTVVRGLPANFYEDKFRNELTETQLEEIDMQPAVPIIHTERTMK